MRFETYGRGRLSTRHTDPSFIVQTVISSQPVKLPSTSVSIDWTSGFVGVATAGFFARRMKPPDLFSSSLVVTLAFEDDFGSAAGVRSGARGAAAAIDGA